jgi:carbonic anhydrase/acetyltransferase-like protein (isoleucine patch superfamily)
MRRVAIVSPNVRIRVEEHFVIGEHSIVDDYCYFSTRVQIGDWTHIATCCSVAGGRDRTFTIGDFSSLSAGVRVWCTSNDFVNDATMIGAAEGISGDVTFADHCGVGANSVVMPRNQVPEVSPSALSASFHPSSHSNRGRFTPAFRSRRSARATVRASSAKSTRSWLASLRTRTRPSLSLVTVSTLARHPAVSA